MGSCCEGEQRQSEMELQENFYGLCWIRFHGLSQTSMTLSVFLNMLKINFYANKMGEFAFIPLPLLLVSSLILNK